MDGNRVVQALYFQDAEMKRFYDLYPELLFMDATYKLTNLRMPLYILLAMGSNGESEIVAFFLTAGEDTAILTDMLNMFKSKNPKWQDMKTVFTDKDMSERDAVKKVFPDVALLLCIFHVLRAMSREITTTKMGITEEQRLSALKFLQKMVYAASEEEYDAIRDNFQNVIPASVVRYVESNWHNCRYEWVRCWQQQNVTYMQRTTNRLESVNKRIKAVVKLLSPLPVFFKDMISIIFCMRKERDHAFVNAADRVAVTSNRFGVVEKQFSQVLIPFALSFVLRQIEETVTVDVVIDNGFPSAEICGKLEPINENNCSCLFAKSMCLLQEKRIMCHYFLKKI